MSDTVRTYISRKARREIKYLAALNGVSMEEFLDLVFVNGYDYKRWPEGLRRLDEITSDLGWKTGDGDQSGDVHQVQGHNKK